MRIITFAWTTPALLAGEKMVTRREWKRHYAESFRAGELISAYDRSQRIGGKKVATIRLTAAPSWEPDSAAPDSDFEAEGFACLQRIYAEDDRVYVAWARERGIEPMPVPALPDRVTLSLQNYDEWRQAGGWSWVIRFELVSVEASG